MVKISLCWILSVSMKIRQTVVMQMNQWLVRLAAVILVLAGTMKVISAFSKVAYLNKPDPFLSFLSNRTLLLVAGNFEILLACLLISSPRAWYTKHGLLALCATFGVYRIGISALHVHGPCPCLGRASDWLHLTPRQTDNLAFTLFIILGTISIVSIILCRLHDSILTTKIKET